MARMTAELEGWIVRDTIAGVPAGSELEANGSTRQNSMRAGELNPPGGLVVRVVSSISLTTQRVIRF